MNALNFFLAEAQRRIDDGAQRSERWILVTDEVGALVGVPNNRDAEQKEIYGLLQPIAALWGKQLRGYNMSGWFISQSPIGLAWLRDCAMTVFAHKHVMENQQKIATNSNRTIMKDMLKWPKGRVVVYGVDIQGQMVLQQPVFSPQVVDASAGSTGPLEDLAPNPMVEVTEEIDAVDDGDNEMDLVVSAYQDGYTSIMRNMAVTGLGQNKTRVLLAKARARGLITEAE